MIPPMEDTTENATTEATHARVELHFVEAAKALILSEANVRAPPQ